MPRFLFLIMLVFPLWSNVPDRIEIERHLGENRYYMEFANTGISNFGDEAIQKKLTEIARLDFVSYQLYLSGRYNQCFRDIEAIRGKIVNLYETLFYDYYEKDTLFLLNEHSASVISRQDKRAMKLLELGYRDLKTARVKANKARYYQKNLKAIKIHLYIEAIKYARQAKRYAFLALMELYTPLLDKKDFQLQTLDEALNKETEKELRTQFQIQNYRLVNMLGRDLFQDTYHYETHQADAYGGLGPGKWDFFHTIPLEELNPPGSAKP